MNIIYLIDFNCPYSYIGLNRMKNAAEGLNLDVEWEMKSFELEPLAGKRASINITERYADKYELSKEDAQNKIDEIEKIAFEDGLEINLKDKLLTSSKDAHRLCKFVQNKYPDTTLQLVEKIFNSTFVKNENIADIKVLTQIAISCELEEHEVKNILDNNYYNIEIELDKEEALTHGITATPCFIINFKGERLIVPGVFSAEEFKTALKDLISGEMENKTFI